MNTPIVDRFGLGVPIFAFSHCRDVVAAVTRAGGLGVLGAVYHTPEQLAIDLAWIDEQVDGLPYGLDLIIPSAYIGEDEGGLDEAHLRALLPAPHVEFVDDLLRRYDIPPLPDGDIPPDGMLSWSHDAASELLEVAFEHKIGLIVNALGPPPPELVLEAHRRNLAVAALVGNPGQALRQRDAGVDIIIAQGYEAGGHTGDIGTMVLVPEVVDAVAPIPVLAAGGIASGRQMLAAMALGAQGVWTGSVWLTTEEAETHPVMKQKFLSASASDTVRSRSRTGKPARQLVSAWTSEWDAESAPEALPMPLQWLLSAEAQARIERSAARTPGAEQLITYFVGQVVGSLKTIRPARRVIADFVEESAAMLVELVEMAERDQESIDA